MSKLTLIVFLLAVFDRLWKYNRICKFFSQPISSSALNSNIPKTATIVQPILSGDPTIWQVLANNLRFLSSYQIDYIWAIDDDDFLAQKECVRVLNEYQLSTAAPRTVTIISLPTAPEGYSPKTFKLVEGFKLSTADILINLDDDTSLPDHSLEIVGELLQRPKTGAVFAVPYYKSFDDIYSGFISSFVNGFSTWTYIPYTYLIKPFTINGMFYAVKRTVYDEVGGLYGLEKDICDDYVFGQRLISQGYFLVQAPLLHPISITVKGLKHCQNIIKRWFVFTNASVLTSTAKNLFVFYTVVFAALFHALALLLLFLIWPNWLSAGLLISYVLLHCFTANLVNRRFLGGATPWWGLLLNELYSFVLPLHATWTMIAPKRINWRGHVMKITRAGKFELVERRDLPERVK